MTCAKINEDRYKQIPTPGRGYDTGLEHYTYCCELVISYAYRGVSSEVNEAINFDGGLWRLLFGGNLD